MSDIPVYPIPERLMVISRTQLIKALSDNPLFHWRIVRDNSRINLACQLDSINSQRVKFVTLDGPEQIEFHPRDTYSASEHYIAIKNPNFTSADVFFIP